MNKKPVVVVGAVAAGTSAASQIKRRNPEMEVIMLEKSPYISYGACGMPYNMIDPTRGMEELIVVCPDDFIKKRKVDTRVENEVIDIDPEKHLVKVRDNHDGRLYNICYGKLVISTGARARLPDIDGLNLKGVFKLRNLADGIVLKDFILKSKPSKAVIIGGGYIAMEMVEVFMYYEMKVTIMKRSQEIPSGYESEIVDRVKAKLYSNGVEVVTGVSIEGFEGKDGKVRCVYTNKGRWESEIVLIAMGVVPEVEIGARAGLEVGERGAIMVNEYLQTSNPEIYSAGDCAVHFHRITRKPSFFPLGTTANKQGRIAGYNIAGGRKTFDGVVGTSVFRVIDLEVARTGLGLSQALKEGFEATKTTITHRSRAHAYPGSKDITVVFVYDKNTGKLLGAQMAGEEGVSKRIDVIACAVTSGMTVEQVSGLDLAYAPPFSPVWDPLLVCANQSLKWLVSGDK